ncbi:MAG TPA: hypothetical protein VGV15_04775, partial [Terriglobales bacterium]|nr:hypothetical protein [Terriglobales bacterium]
MGVKRANTIAAAVRLKKGGSIAGSTPKRWPTKRNKINKVERFEAAHRDKPHHVPAIVNLRWQDFGESLRGTLGLNPSVRFRSVKSP